MEDKKTTGSSPFIRTKKASVTPVNRALQEFEKLAHLAHLGGSDDYALGGDNKVEQMRAQVVKLHATGKRWYVSYYTKHPSGKLERRRAYGYVNAEKDLEKRMELLIELQNRVFHEMQQTGGFNEHPISTDTNIYKATNRMLSDKKEYLKPESFRTITTKLNPWKRWLLDTNMSSKHPASISKVDILNFRNYLLQKGISNRTINNHCDEVRAVFNYIMKNMELISRNPCSNIDHLPSRSETHVAYTNSEMAQIADYLREKDEVLLFFIKLISYVFLRTNEARTLQIKHIDVPGERILLTAENNKVNRRAWKMIPKIMIEDFRKLELHNYPKEYYLFGPYGEPSKQRAGVDIFAKRFKKVKDKFGFTRKHTLYGFRHTSVSQLLKSGKKWNDVMKLTGHTQMTSFEKYARSVTGGDPIDLSDGFSDLL